jgi:hypothetical protein
MTNHNKFAVLAGGCFWAWQNMPSPLSNDMGSVTQDKDPTTPRDWQVLLSGYAPLVLYAAVCAAGWVLRRPSNRRAAVTG